MDFLYEIDFSMVNMLLTFVNDQWETNYGEWKNIFIISMEESIKIIRA